MRKRKLVRLFGLVFVFALIATACPREEKPSVQESPEAPQVTSDTGAAELRAALNRLQAEHAALAAAAANAALGGRTAEFNAAAEALNGKGKSNSSDIIAAIGSAYGAEAGTPSTRCGGSTSCSSSIT